MCNTALELAYCSCTAKEHQHSWVGLSNAGKLWCYFISNLILKVIVFMFKLVWENPAWLTPHENVPGSGSRHTFQCQQGVLMTKDGYSCRGFGYLFWNWVTLFCWFCSSLSYSLLLIYLKPLSLLLPDVIIMHALSNVYDLNQFEKWAEVRKCSVVQYTA